MPINTAALDIYLTIDLFINNYLSMQLTPERMFSHFTSLLFSRHENPGNCATGKTTSEF